VNQAKTLEKLLKDLEEASPAAFSPVADAAPGPFQFSDALDKNKIRVQSPSYVKKNCNHCYGKGFETYLIGGGYFPKAPGHVSERIPRQARSLRACRCVTRGYIRAAMAFMRAKKADE
jgi:hypothetical protein